MYQLKEFMIMAMVGTAVGLQQNGVSTTKERDVLRYDIFTGHGGQQKVQWDYRDFSGKLHTSICGTIQAAREQAARYGYIENASREEMV
jgi:hypothetical protein